MLINGFMKRQVLMIRVDDGRNSRMKTPWTLLFRIIVDEKLEILGKLFYAAAERDSLVFL